MAQGGLAGRAKDSRRFEGQDVKEYTAVVGGAIGASAAAVRREKMDKIKVIISNRQKQVKIPTGVRMLIRRCCHAVLQMEEIHGSVEISVSFVDNEQIREMNRQYRQKDSATDVLSFPLGENGEYDINHETGAKVLGDIVISVPKVVEQARTYGHSFEREIAYLTAHSMLHLLGYDHEQGGLERVRMREKEEYVMRELGLPASSSYTNAE